jgi:hypothetical protein
MIKESVAVKPASDSKYIILLKDFSMDIKVTIRYYFVILMMMLINGCKEDSNDKGMIILKLTESAFHKLKEKKIYLAYKHQIIDSMEVNQNIIKLYHSHDKIDYSQFYSLLYWDTKDDYHFLRPIGFPP